MCIWIWLCSVLPHDQQLSYTAYLRLLCRETYLHIWGCFVGTCISMRITVCRLDCSLITWICRSWKNLWSIIWTPTQDNVLGSQGRVKVSSPSAKSEPGTKGKTMPCKTIVIGHTQFIISQSKSSCSPKQTLFIYLIPNTVPSIVCRITLKLLGPLSHIHHSRGGGALAGQFSGNHYREKRVLWIHWDISCQFGFVICIHKETIAQLPTGTTEIWCGSY